MQASHPWSSPRLYPVRDSSFLGCPFKVWSDSEKVLNEFGKIYERFQSAEEYIDRPVEDLQPLSIYIITATSNHKPVLWAGGETILLEEGEIPARMYFFILNYLLPRGRKFFHPSSGALLKKTGKALSSPVLPPRERQP